MNITVFFETVLDTTLCQKDIPLLRSSSSLPAPKFSSSNKLLAETICVRTYTQDIQSYLQSTALPQF